MRFTEDIESYEIIRRFCRDKVRKGGNLVVENIVYLVDLYVSGDPPGSFKSIQKIKLQRRWIPSSQSYNGSVWCFGSESIPLEMKHFEPTVFHMQKDDKGHILSVVALLALKRKLDYLSRFPVDGLLFRSELLRLVRTESWRGRDAELDRIVSGMKRYTTTGREKRAYYANHPLRDRFLLADNEVYNLICWTGSGKPRASGMCLEKAWVINIEPEQIRVFDQKGSEMLGQSLRAYLDAVFPGHLLIHEGALEKYREMIVHGEKPWFEVDLQQAGKGETSAGVVSGRSISVGHFRKSEGEQPSIIDFGEYFRKCEGSKFVGRVELLKRLDEKVQNEKIDSQFVLVVGEAGIGKTALIAKWMSDKRDKVVHYFCEESKRHRLDAKAFAKHLLASLCWIHGHEAGDLDEDLGTLIELLNKKIAGICKLTGGETKRIIIAVDALDESLSFQDKGITIVDVLRSLDKVEGLRVVVSSRDTPELKRFIAPDHENVILMTGDDPKNQQDIELYYKEHLAVKRSKKSDLRVLLERTEGNFLYAALCVEMVERGEASIGWLLNNAPGGLAKLYEWKLEVIRQRVRNEDALDVIWLLMRAITLIPATLTPRQLSELLDLDPLSLPQSLGLLMQFLDLDQLRANEGCRWFHRSFTDYVLSNVCTTDRKKGELYRVVVSSCKDLVRNQRASGLSGLVPGKITWMYSNYAQPEEVLSYMRREFFPTLFSTGYKKEWRASKLAEEIGSAFALAIRSGLKEHVIFFGLLAWALDSLTDCIFEGMARERPKTEDWNRRINNTVSRLKAPRDAKSRMAKAAAAHIKGEIDFDEMTDLICDCYLRLRRQLHPANAITEFCEKMARECAELS